MSAFGLGTGSERGERPVAHRIVDARPRCRIVVTGIAEATGVVPHGAGVAYRVVLSDGSGTLEALFLGRRHVAGIEPGVCCTVEGMVQARTDRHVVWNPRYELYPSAERTDGPSSGPARGTASHDGHPSALELHEGSRQPRTRR